MSFLNIIALLKSELSARKRIVSVLFPRSRSSGKCSFELIVASLSALVEVSLPLRMASISVRGIVQRAIGSRPSCSVTPVGKDTSLR